MASAESAKMGSLVAPAAPADAKEADDAVTGEVSKYQGQTHEPKAEEKKQGKKDPEKKGWIEVQLVDENGKGIPGEEYEIIDPDECVWGGTTNDQGVGRVEGIAEGNCKVTFPRLDGAAWEPA